MSTTRYLRPSSKPLVPRAQPVRDTLQRDAGLRSLTAAAQAGLLRLETIKPAIPKALHGSLAAGGVDDEGWTLMVKHAAGAAKLRQLKPQLQMLLQERFGPGELRIKLMSR